MSRLIFGILDRVTKMTNIPPRKVSGIISRSLKQNASPIQILLQMGFPRHRALKALAATGNRSVQLASDWLLTHVNDSHLDTVEPREYIFYASPTGPLLAQLTEFWEKSKKITGWNGAHNFLPHLTLVSFFKAPDETSLHLSKAVKYVVEKVGDPPKSPLIVEPYVSHNFMGLFISNEHADYLRRIAVQYVKQVSTESVSLEPHLKSLHVTLAYHFENSMYDTLKGLVDEMQPLQQGGWELRLYSRDPRFSNHQVYKVTEGYGPKASDELELVIGDYIYVEEEQLNSSSDGWLHGTSWLTGVAGYLPAVYLRRTAESDAWTLHRAMSLTHNNGTESKSDSASTADGESYVDPHGDAALLGYDKSEDVYKEWDNYWNTVQLHRFEGIMDITHGTTIDWQANSTNGDTVRSQGEDKSKKRWVYAFRHGERVDLTFGHWVKFCFDENGRYLRKDLNMPLKLTARMGGPEAYAKDSPLTRIGRFQAFLSGEGIRLANAAAPKHVYSSSALRCVETAHEFLVGVKADPSVKIRVEPGLFEFTGWHSVKGLDFMTPKELLAAGYNVDLDYIPYISEVTTETLEEFYQRNEKVVHLAIKDTEEEGGDIMFVGHASTIDTVTIATRRLTESDDAPRKPYEINQKLLKVPYCALAALHGPPWVVVPPPCPPSLNSSSGRYDWRIMKDC